MSGDVDVPVDVTGDVDANACVNADAKPCSAVGVLCAVIQCCGYASEEL